jgi:hypothetical protein
MERRPWTRTVRAGVALGAFAAALALALALGLAPLAPWAGARGTEAVAAGAPHDERAAGHPLAAPEPRGAPPAAGERRVPDEARPATGGTPRSPAAEPRIQAAEARGPRSGAPSTPGAPVHAVRGRVRARSGAWTDLERLLAGHLRIELWPAAGLDAAQEDGAPPLCVARLERVDDPSGESWIGFALPPVPAGAWTLAVGSTEALRVVPARLELDVPSPPLDLWLQDDVATLALGFRVLDAETLAPVHGWTAWSVRTVASPDAGVLFHAAPLALDDVPLDAALAWRLWAPSYAPESGDERAFAAEEDGRWIAEVRLRRGWGRRFVALGRAPTMRPLRGARVELDGALAGATDAAGGLEVVRDAPPERYAISWEGLRAEGAVPSDAAADGRARITVVVLR